MGMTKVHNSRSTDPSEEDWRDTESHREMECYTESRPDRARGETLEASRQGSERFLQVASACYELSFSFSSSSSCSRPPSEPLSLRAVQPLRRLRHLIPFLTPFPSLGYPRPFRHHRPCPLALFLLTSASTRVFFASPRRRSSSRSSTANVEFPLFFRLFIGNGGIFHLPESTKLIPGRD